MQSEFDTLLKDAMAAISALRKSGGHLHSITNTVAQNFTANVLLACGASDSMTANPIEIEAFMSKADALHLNLGTLSDKQIEAITIALHCADQKNIPVALDPVMVHVSETRLQFAKELMPAVSIVKANRAEAEILNTDKSHPYCLMETGELDSIHYRGAKTSIANGTSLLAGTIATGCALGALIAILASKTSSQAACVAGALWFSISGEIAAEKASGPGSFVPEFLDALYSVSEEELLKRAKIQ